jgi:multidrug efflux system membrane fusion protein
MLSRSSTLATLLTVSLAAAGCTAGGEAERLSGAAAPSEGRGGGGAGAVPVTVASVVEKPMPLDLQTIGTVEAFSNVAVHAQLTGELTSVNFKEGDDVNAGDVLFTLDRRPLEAILQQAEANLERDQAQLANATAQAKRYQDLADRGIATKEQVDTSSTSAAALLATVGADRAAVENARVQLQYATIKAPLSGRTGALMVHPGNLVRANDATPLVIINQIVPIYVSFSVPEAQLPDLKRYLAQGSTKVEAQPPNDIQPPAEGRITFIDNAVDQTTGTIRVKASLPNVNHQLWPGQFVNVTLTLTTELHAIVVPSAAVQTGQQGPYVFVVKPDQTAELRNVDVERSTATMTILKSGVKPGETVVTDGQLRLVSGSRVSIKNESQKAES